MIHIACKPQKWEICIKANADIRQSMGNEKEPLCVEEVMKGGAGGRRGQEQADLIPQIVEQFRRLKSITGPEDRPGW